MTLEDRLQKMESYISPDKGSLLGRISELEEQVEVGFLAFYLIKISYKRFTNDSYHDITRSEFKLRYDLFQQFFDCSQNIKRILLFVLFWDCFFYSKRHIRMGL